MAIVKGFLQLSGSLKGVSFYTRRGSDQVIMRTKGGATKEKMATAPQYAGIRKSQNEFGGCSKFASMTRFAFGGLSRLADYNLNAVLSGMGKNLMKLDTEAPVGQRRILLSQHKQLLEGFNFNRTYPFNTVLRVGITAVIDREHLMATVTIPRINTDIDLVNIQRLPYFRLIAVLGTVSDMHYDETQGGYIPAVQDLHGTSAVVNGDWYPAQTIVPEHTMTVQMTETQQALLTDEVTVLLSLAVEFGAVGFNGETTEVKYAGCGKVVKVK
ncbi:MAG: hypothetical protein Q8935_20995 [Bacillota bacterium]|nr:hypothetical protein [Bacillota bacterium]